MENYQENINNDQKITQEDIIEIRSKLTREGAQILVKIYEMPGIRHKELGEVLNKTANNLSNMIKKINTISIKLILPKKEKVEKHYFLTDIAKQYVEKELLQTEQSEKSHEDTCFHKNESIARQVLDALDLFKKEAGERWHFILYDLLCKKNENIHDNIRAVYEKLSDLLCQCQIQNDDTLQQIFESLEDKHLTEQIKSYLSGRLYYYYCLEPLLSLSNAEAYKIIDSIFFELQPLIFSSDQSDEQQFEPALSLEKYNNTLVGIVKLSAKFINEHCTKNIAVEKWHSDYFLDEALAFYIAEKCSTIMKYFH